MKPELPFVDARDLRVEHLRAIERVPIAVPEPLMSWALHSAHPEGEQTACEVRVAGDPALLDSAAAALWSSGRQATNVPALRLPNGVLESNSRYWWTVRLWNADDAPGPFAEAASFETGSLSANARPPRPIQVQSAIAPAFVGVNGMESTFVDFGRAAFGTIRLRVPEAMGGESVTVHFGEKCKGNDTVDRSPGATIRYLQTSVRLAPSGEWTVVVIPDYGCWPSIADLPAAIGQVVPFRYVELEGLPQPLAAADIEQLAVHTPWDGEACAFSSSDDVLNQVWELCTYSIKATTFAAVYVDGDRERLPYEADAYINQLCHYCCEPAYALARFSHEWLIDNPTWPTEWKHHSILMAHADWLYTGDCASLGRCYARLQGKLFPGAERDDGLVRPASRDLVDWPAGERDGYLFVNYNTVVNAFQYRSLRCMAEIAAALGHEADSADYAARADTLYNAFNAVFWDAGQRLYTDGEGTKHCSLHANMFALAFGLVPDERLETVMDHVIGKGMACSVYGAHFLLESLFMHGESGVAVELMRSVAVRSWYNMIRAGSTITLEAWDSSYKPNLDWNHAWGAAPAAALPRWVLGVQPLKPGFRLIRVQPQPGPLDWIDGKVPTPLGPLILRVSRDSDCALNAVITAPPGCRLLIDLPLPSSANGNLSLNGSPANFTSCNGRAILPELVSGTYRIRID